MTLALPPSDPRSAEIWAHLDGLGGDADASAELRRLICEALGQGARLARIEDKLDRTLAGGVGVAPAGPGPLSADELSALLSFDT